VRDDGSRVPTVESERLVEFFIRDTPGDLRDAAISNQKCVLAIASAENQSHSTSRNIDVVMTAVTETNLTPSGQLDADRASPVTLLAIWRLAFILRPRSRQREYRG
jgi:hypothetical protein